MIPGLWDLDLSSRRFCSDIHCHRISLQERREVGCAFPGTSDGIHVCDRALRCPVFPGRPLTCMALPIAVLQLNQGQGGRARGGPRSGLPERHRTPGYSSSDPTVATVLRYRSTATSYSRGATTSSWSPRRNRFPLAVRSTSAHAAPRQRRCPRAGPVSVTVCVCPSTPPRPSTATDSVPVSAVTRTTHGKPRSSSSQRGGGSCYRRLAGSSRRRRP